MKGVVGKPGIGTPAIPTPKHSHPNENHTHLSRLVFEWVTCSVIWWNVRVVCLRCRVAFGLEVKHIIGGTGN